MRAGQTRQIACGVSIARPSSRTSTGRIGKAGLTQTRGDGRRVITLYTIPACDSLQEGRIGDRESAVARTAEAVGNFLDPARPLPVARVEGEKEAAFVEETLRAPRDGSSVVTDGSWPKKSRPGVYGPSICRGRARSRFSTLVRPSQVVTAATRADRGRGDL